jgi:hypothetical protein
MRTAWIVMFLVACGGDAQKVARPRVAAAQPAGPTATQQAANQIPEQLVIEGTIALEVDEITDLVPALRAKVDADGGRVISEVVAGGERSWSAALKLRLPPDKVEDVVAFLASRGDITAKNISATDVSKQLFDEELAIKNLKTTLDRLTALMDKSNLDVQQILQIEQEMTRIRGQIEQLEGDQRFLKDRVALATLEVSIARREGAVTIAKAKAYPGARAAMLTLFDPGTRARTRFGGGVVLHPVLPEMSLEVDMFQKELDATGMALSPGVIATFGGTMYSDYLGGGRRAALNPYLGLRMGYAYLDSSRFVIQGEVGVELFKSKYVVLDANARATGLIGADSDVGLVTGIGATVAF